MTRQLLQPILTSAVVLIGPPELRLEPSSLLRGIYPPISRAAAKGGRFPVGTGDFDPERSPFAEQTVWSTLNTAMLSGCTNSRS
jgi:hypothetical protein